MIKILAVICFLSHVSFASPKAVIEQIRVSPFVPFNPAQVWQVRNELKVALRIMNQKLNTQTAEIANGWKEYLALELMDRYANGETVDDEKIDRAIWLYSRNMDGLEYKEITDLRAALLKYRDTVRIAALPEGELKQQFEKNKEELLTLLQTATESPEKVNTLVLGRLVQWMESAQQMTTAVAQIKPQFEKSNFNIKISSKILMSTLNTDEAVDRTDPLVDNFKGTELRGETKFSGRSKVALVPTPNRGLIGVMLSGVGVTTSDGVNINRSGKRIENGVATLHGTTTSNVFAQGNLVVTPKGIVIEGASAQANVVAPAPAVTFTPDVLVPGILRAPENRLIYRVRNNQGNKQAGQRVQQEMPESRQYAKGKAEAQAKEQLDEEIKKRVGSRVDEFNENYQKNFYLPFYRHAVFPSDIQFSTSKDFIVGNGTMKSYAQFGNLSEPPPLQLNADLSMQMHESAINNFLEAAYGWYDATDKYIEDAAKLILGDVPPELWVYKGSAPWRATLARNNPMVIQIGEDTIDLTINVLTLKRGEEASNSFMVGAKYKVVRDGKEISFERDGDIRYQFKGTVDPAKFDVNQFALAKGKSLLPPKTRLPNFSFPEGELGIPNVPNLQTNEIIFSKGWMAASFDIREKKTKPVK